MPPSVQSTLERPTSYVPPSSESVVIDEEILNTPLTDTEARAVKKLEKRSKLPNKLTAGLGAAAILLSTVSFMYHNDVETNRELAASSNSEIHSLDDEKAPQLRSSIFYLAGFDTRNADVYGERVGKVAIQQFVPGNNESVDYGDAPLNPEKIAKNIIEIATKQNLEAISLAGYSMGGEVVAQVADYIITNTPIQVQALIFNSTPDGTQGLRSETQSDLTNMVNALKLLPNSEYSTVARWAITMAQEHDRYTNGDLLSNITNFSKTSSDVYELVQEHRRPGAWLLVDQAGAIKNSNLESTLSHIGSMRSDKRMPVIIYMGAEDPNDDTVVNVKVSSKNICSYSSKAHLSCYSIPVPHAIHTSYLYDSDAYKQAASLYTDDIQAAIEFEDTQYKLTHNLLSAPRVRLY